MQSFHVEGCGNGFTHEQNHEYRMACEQTKVAYEVTKQKDKEMVMACECDCDYCVIVIMV